MLANKHGKAICWDCTCVDIFESVHVTENVVRAGSVVNAAETVDIIRYRSQTDSYQFEAVQLKRQALISKGQRT